MMTIHKNKYREYIFLLRIIVLLTLISCTFVPQSLFAEEIKDRHESAIRKLIINGGYIAAREGRHILSYNSDKQFIPASIWKVVTALAAIETLGKDYRFKTGFYLDNHKDLYIKGFGDPFIISEEIDLIYKKLIEKGIVEINNIYMDISSFDSPEPPPGGTSSLNPYDAINGALAVNFNTVYFNVDGSGTVKSAEEQTPTLLIMKDLGRKFKRGRHRINISGSPENVSRHTGELFRAFQNQYKIPGKGSESEKNTPDSLKPLYVHYSSKTLIDIIKEMMLYSNNYISNQIFLTMGAYEYGYPATWEKGEKYLEHYLETNFPKYKNEIKVSEGSGISRDNRITPRAFMEILKRYKPYARTLPLDKGRYAKSGTLNGVYSNAGYIKSDTGYDCFVIILNQRDNTRGRILELIKKYMVDSGFNVQ
ncbi:D-alanyl-D-alanine carboxypeptidase/D-alanyl-D-alanine-endopeptidase [Thermodesulfobacteriota bacterium]